MEKLTYRHHHPKINHAMPNANELAREICKSFETYINYLPVGSYDDVTENWLSTPEAKSLIAQLSGVGGMKWVKASELPAIDGIYITKDKDGEVKEFYFKKKSPTHWHYLDMSRTLPSENVCMTGHIIEYLSESPIPSGEQDGGWIEFKEGNELPEYDELVAWASEDGLMFFDMLDKDGNPWIFVDKEDPEWGHFAKVTHWRKIKHPNDL